jgi:hypothetical protein
MTPVGQDRVELRIAEAVEPALFVDEAELADVVVRTVHRVEPLEGERNRVVYRMEIRSRGAKAALTPRCQRSVACQSKKPGLSPG